MKKSKRKQFIIFLLSIFLLGILPLTFSNNTGAEMVRVTSTQTYYPGFYWCQHLDGHWSTYSSYEKKTYTASDSNGEPSKTLVKTYADIVPPNGTWKFSDGSSVPSSLNVTNVKPVNGSAKSLRGFAGDDAGIENNQVWIKGYSGPGYGVERHNVCGGNPSAVYPFPVEVTFEGYVYIENKTCTLEIEPNNVTLDLGETRNLEAYVTWSDQPNNRYPVATRSETTWLSTNSSKVSVTKGTVKGISPTGGSPVWVQATFSKDGATCSANASVTVVNNTAPSGHPVRVEIRPDEYHIRIGDWVQYRSYLIYSNGGEEEVTQDRNGQWSNNNTTVAGFKGGGVETWGQVVGKALGTATIGFSIRTSNGELSDTAKLYVEENPQTPGPPDPPEEENEPPVARWSGPTYAKPGDTIMINNTSYDTDGYIVDVDWDIDPSYGVSEDLDDYGGTITFYEEGEFDVTIEVTDDDGDSDDYTRTVVVENRPPKADIDAPSTVIQGDDVIIASDSYDPDGTIERIEWSISPDDGSLMSSENEQPTTLEGEENKVWFDKPGEYEITLTVTDDLGKSDTETHTITVEPAIPTAFWTWTGFQKQNRAMFFDGTGSKSSKRYPIISYNWEFIPPKGVDASRIKIRNKMDTSTRDVMFKEPGTYNIRLTVTNTAGHTSPVYEQNVLVLPDLHPNVDFYVEKQILREEVESAGEISTAKIQLVDRSASPDADEISKRVWTYRYDSDNDGSFEDETWVTLDNGNNPTPVLETKDVGKYQFELYVEEKFGQPTLEEFIEMPADLRFGDTSQKELEHKTIEVINSPPVASFGIGKKYKADIVFALGQVDNNKIKNFSSKVDSILIPKLAARNIQANVTSVAAHNVDIQDTFSWVEYNNYYTDSAYMGYNGNPSHIIVEGKNLKFFGYYSTAHKDWLFLPDNQQGKKRFDFFVDEAVTDWHTLEGAGYLFNATISDGILKGYAILLAQNGIQLWEIGGVDVNNFHAGTYNSMSNVPNNKLLGTYTKTGSKHQIRIEVTQEKIDMWDNGEKIIDNQPLPTVYGNGFGPMVSYLGHRCSSLSRIEFKNITMEATTGKSITEIVKEPEWRSINGRFIANISDVNVPEFSDPIAKSIILSRLLNENVDYSTFGTTANKAEALNIISLNNNNGIWINNNNMDVALSTYADYIISKFEGLEDNGQYVLLGEEISYDTSYDDRENDPKYSERWRYTHDYKYFDNDLGLFPYHNVFVPNPFTTFTKVGRYDTVFQARDNPKNDDRFDIYRLWSDLSNTNSIFVHRRPVADFAFSISPRTETTSNLTINNLSYDLDHSISRSDKGIVQEKWKWKTAGASTWSLGKPSVISNDETYLISLEVLDPEGVWSYPTVKIITTALNLPPVAMFTVEPAAQPYNYSTGKSKPFVYDASGSYDPNPGDTITYSWRYQKDGGNWVNAGATMPSTFPAIGKYRIELVVTDNHGLQSEPYYQSVEVLPNQPPVPGFFINEPVYVGDDIEVYSTAYDVDNSLSDLRFRYEVTKPNGTVMTYQSGNPQVDNNGHLKIDTVDGDQGIWTIKQWVTDEIADWQGPAIDSVTVLDVGITGKVKHTDQWDKIHAELGHGFNANVFYSGERFMLEAETSLEASKVAFVEVTMTGQTVKGETKTVTTTLTPESPTSNLFTGSIYEEWMSEPSTMLKVGEDVTFTFRTRYINDIERTDIETVTIIGIVYDAFDYHRSF